MTTNAIGGQQEMKIFITDASNAGLKRIVHLLDHMQNIRVVGNSDNAASAAAKLKNLKPDIFIVDIDLPANIGIALIKQVLKEQPSLCVIVLTDASFHYFRRKCLEMGVKFFFDKSTEFQFVPLVIKELMMQFDQSVYNQQSINKHTKGE